ncbi:hypothetical protein A8950_0369 [Dongia mobilis]|uniref:Uncharacterized protein n=1 Tax=Dongia mobilis TaxID=578943 RepID=A0A4R6WQT0_9PROT|nr:hypothetical protein [Dongia mobilis]TDQ83826.1 hypothetical protein A8950_0369 [Dongia mobilis]
MAKRGRADNPIELTPMLLDNLFARKKPKQKDARTRAPGAPKKDSASIKIASGWETAASRLAEIGARRVLVHGDAAALAAARASLPGRDITWISHALAEVGAGAQLAEDLDWSGFDAAICAGSDLAARYRQSLRLMLAGDATRPVLWVGEGFEFCGGSLSAPLEADEVEGLLFNHFQEFFGVKDPLQFRIEVYHGPEVKRFYRILEPNQSLVLRLGAYFPQRQHPTSLAAFVEHPILTRERHYRLRLCADVFWRGSFTTLHSAHEFGRSPSHKVEFRAPAWLVRQGEVALTIPNFEHNADAAMPIETSRGGRPGQQLRDTGSYLQQANLPRDGSADGSFMGWRYRGYGGSNWFALDSLAQDGTGLRNSIAGNHHVSCPIEDRPDFAASPAEIARFAEVLAQGYLVEPYGVPLRLPGNLEFGFEADAANPSHRHLRIDFFDAAGSHLGHQEIVKSAPGPLFAGDILAGWDDPKRDAAHLAFIIHDFARAGLRYKGFKAMANLVVRDRRSGDRDFTEFQSCWRNLGAAVPGFPHWLSDQLAIVGRTNVFGRVRCDRGLRTAVMAVHGSGRLGYRNRARTEFIAVNNAGKRLSGSVTIPSFTAQMIWLDELLPGLADHLGTSGNGALLVQSGDADLACQIVTTSPAGAVALQHLWGY